MKTAEVCEALCRETVEKMGYSLCDVEYKKEYSDMVLTFFIDKEGGVTIDDCELVSRALDPVLDEADPIAEPYVLSVSSLGIDRPLKKNADYERNLGKELEIKLYAPMQFEAKKPVKEFTAVLESYTDDTFTVKGDVCGDCTLQKKDAALVRPYIRFE